MPRDVGSVEPRRVRQCSGRSAVGAANMAQAGELGLQRFPSVRRTVLPPNGGKCHDHEIDAREGSVATREVRIDRGKTLLEDPGTGHNRWHPDIPPVLRAGGRGRPRDA